MKDLISCAAIDPMTYPEAPPARHPRFDGANGQRSVRSTRRLALFLTPRVIPLMLSFAVAAFSLSVAARASDPNSANSQFFICFGDGCRRLTGSYTLWGEVISGMEHVDRIATGEPPAQPDIMHKVYLLADAQQ